MAKEYLNIDESIQHLIKDKHIDCLTINSDVFIEKPYLNLVNPYTDLISYGRDANNNHIYKQNETFDKFIVCNKLDAAISDKLHCLLSTFENRLKSFLMHKYCEKMKSNGDPLSNNYSWLEEYKAGKHVFDLLPLDEQLYDGFIVKSSDSEKNNRIEAIDEVNRIANETDSSSDYMVQHYKEVRGYVPFFVAVQKMTLGKLLVLFSILPTQDKREFVSKFINAKEKNIGDKKVSIWELKFKRMNIIRNKIAHYEPIFPFLLNIYPDRRADFIALLQKMNDCHLRSVLSHNVIFNDLVELSFDHDTSIEEQFRFINRVVQTLK